MEFIGRRKELEVLEQEYQRPGGFVVPASSIPDGVVVNGMSEHARDQANANSALLVQVTPADYGHDPFDGMRFQEELEHRAFLMG